MTHFVLLLQPIEKIKHKTAFPLAEEGACLRYA